MEREGAHTTFVGTPPGASLLLKVVKFPSLPGKPLHDWRACRMRGRRRLQAQRINPEGFQGLAERDDQHATFNRFAREGHVGHGHTQASRGGIKGQFVEVEHTEHKYYLYEAITNPDLLTGMMDERGIRLATWNYDEQGRAISSEHANGAFKTTITYSDDGSVSVTNELGRTTAYQFKTVQGIKRIISITGQPSSNCPLSNSTFSYNDRGQLSQKTDATGSVTTFNYNDRGLEVGRTEASGTPLARTTTTEWDPSHFLKTKVIESTRTKYYTYDDQGRLSATQIIPN
jgi:YD repeat-containing protein